MKKQIFIPLLAILISTAILFGLSLGLSHIQEANAKAELEAKLSTLLPGSSSFTEEIYTGEDVKNVFHDVSFPVLRSFIIF